jgi:hypothetical protein
MQKKEHAAVPHAHRTFANLANRGGGTPGSKGEEGLVVFGVLFGGPGFWGMVNPIQSLHRPQHVAES